MVISLTVPIMSLGMGKQYNPEQRETREIACKGTSLKVILVLK
jgi:hypothetical protein